MAIVKSLVLASAAVGVVVLLNQPITTAPPILAANSDDFVQTYWDNYCLRCHGEQKQKGDLRIDQLSTDFAKGPSNMKWMEIIERINAREMPPKDEKQPTADESAKAVEWIAGKLKEGELARLAKREKVSFHKLTREEYTNTIRDLLGVQFDASDPNGLPDDPEWHGFERIGLGSVAGPLAH